MSTRHLSAGRGLPLTALVATAIGAGALLGMPSASADVRLFELHSEAVAVQSTATDPAVPLGLPFSVGAYGASSSLNSNGESSSDAGAPYSPLVSSLPNTGNGVAQGTFGASLPVVPTFPGYVSAKDPVTPRASQTAGVYELLAIAEPAQSRGTVSVGGQAALSEQNNAFAIANSLTREDGVFTEGAAGVHALTLGGILDLANVSSSATMTAGPAGQPAAETTTSLGTISFAGLTSGLTGDGVTALGSAPTPVSADNLGALNEALKPSGITLTYLPEIYFYSDGSQSSGPAINTKKTVTGVTSGALQIFLTNTSDRGITTETVTLGRVAVTATSTSVGSGTAVAPSGTGAAGLPATGLDADNPGSGLDGIAAGAIPGAALVGATPGATVPFLSAASAGAVDFGPSFESFYLVLLAAGGVAMLGSQAVRVLAIRR